MRKLQAFLSSGLLLSIIACSTPGGSDTGPIAELPATGTNERVDHSGTYVGSLPDAEGRAQRTRLDLTADGRFKLTLAGARDSASVDEGPVQWLKPSHSFQLVVGEASLRFNANGDRITYVHTETKGGDAIPADGATWMLIRQRPVNVSGEHARLLGSHWVLIEAEGKAVVTGPNTSKASMALDGASGKLSGTTGCNTVQGSFATADGGGLRFADLAMTTNTCPDMTIDAAMRAMLPRVDSYSISGDVASLKEGSTVLARFRMQASR